MPPKTYQHRKPGGWCTKEHTVPAKEHGRLVHEKNTNNGRRGTSKPSQQRTWYMNAQLLYIVCQPHQCLRSV